MTCFKPPNKSGKETELKFPPLPWASCAPTAQAPEKNSKPMLGSCKSLDKRASYWSFLECSKRTPQVKCLQSSEKNSTRNVFCHFISILSCIPLTASAFSYLENNYPFMVIKAPLFSLFPAFGPFHCSLIFASEARSAALLCWWV